MCPLRAFAFREKASQAHDKAMRAGIPEATRRARLIVERDWTRMAEKEELNNAMAWLDSASPSAGCGTGSRTAVELMQAMEMSSRTRRVAPWAAGVGLDMRRSSRSAIRFQSRATISHARRVSSALALNALLSASRARIRYIVTRSFICWPPHKMRSRHVLNFGRASSPRGVRVGGPQLRGA